MTIVLMTGISGCERSYGVSRTAELAEFPDVACVREAIAEVLNGGEFREWEWPDSNTDAEAVAPTVRAHHFSYGVRDAQVELGIFEDAPTKIRWIQSYIQAHRVPPQERIDEARKTMVDVESWVAANCHVLGLSRRVREACSGVECN